MTRGRPSTQEIHQSIHQFYFQYFPNEWKLWPEGHGERICLFVVYCLLDFEILFTFLLDIQLVWWGSLDVAWIQYIIDHIDMCTLYGLPLYVQFSWCMLIFLLWMLWIGTNQLVLDQCKLSDLGVDFPAIITDCRDSVSKDFNSILEWN